MLVQAGCASSPSPAPPTATAPRINTKVPASATAAVPATGTHQSAVPTQLTGYEFPASINRTSRFLFYLHGKIIEDQGLPAVSPEFGEYEYAAILKAFADKGFVVISQQRPKDADVEAYAREVGGQVALLINAGVPPGHITVVGASKGAWIAATVSHLLTNPNVNYVLLATCPPSMVEEWVKTGVTLHGNVLSIYDAADREYAGSCEQLFLMSAGKGLGRHREIVLHIGTGHGIVYKPLDDWVLPTVQWAGG